MENLGDWYLSAYKWSLLNPVPPESGVTCLQILYVHLDLMELRADWTDNLRFKMPSDVMEHLLISKGIKQAHGVI